VAKKSAVKKCKSCGEAAGANGHLCVPVGRADHTCDWCGSLIMDARHMCDKKLKKVSYICNTCGRLAVSAEHLCKPKKIS
jgi:hypothetical protein